MSSLSGKGSGDVLDVIVERLPPVGEAEAVDELRVAVVGVPNVGKSSFVNRLLGEERLVVSDEAGTTRDVTDLVFWSTYDPSVLTVADTGLATPSVALAGRTTILASLQGLNNSTSVTVVQRRTAITGGAPADASSLFAAAEVEASPSRTPGVMYPSDETVIPPNFPGLEFHFLPGQGNDLFQIAYVTNDIERALGVFAEQYGVKEWRRMEGELKDGGHIRVEFGWAGGSLFEVTEATGAGSELYRQGLPADEFAIRFHHLGFIVQSADDWQALLKEIDTGGVKVVNETNVPGFLQARIVEAPNLGHWIEYIFPEAGGLAFFQGSPSN